MKKYGKETASVALIVLSFVLALCRPFSNELSQEAYLVISSLICATSLWVFQPFGISLGTSSCILMALLLSFGIPANVVFSGFTQTSVWTMIPALFFGFALKKTGLGKRLVYIVLSKFKKITYYSLVGAWTIIGVILSFLTPSITVRVIIIMPLAVNCADLCKLPKASKGRSLVLLTAWSMSLIPSIGWFSGSLLGPILTGIFSATKDMPEITSSIWIKAALLPSVLASLMLLIGGCFALKPENRIVINIDDVLDSSMNIKEISRNERITAIVLVLCFVLLATEKLHGLSSTVVCLLGFSALCVTKVIDGKEISSGISWDLVLFVGASMCFGSVFSYSGVSAWLKNVLMPVFMPFAGKPGLLIVVMLFFLFIWRFFDIALLTPSVVVLSTVLPSVHEVCGIHPAVWIPVFSFAICSFFMSYENMFLMMGESCMNGSGWKANHRILYATVYFVCCIVTVIVMVPYWKCVGLIV